jgi:putative ABC transport system permease protein
MRTNFKLALKILGRRKFFTFISLFGISLTLVVLMVATAVLDNLFAPREPEQNFDRVLGIYRVSLRGKEATETMNPGFKFLDSYVRPLPGIEAFGMTSEPTMTATYVGGSRIDVVLRHTDAPFWQITRFRFLEGRHFTKQEDDSGARVAVITDELRGKLFGSGSALGKTITVQGDNFRVIGVVPAVPDTRQVSWGQMWVPIGSYPSSDYRQQFMGNFIGLVMAHSKNDLPRIRAAFDAAAARVPIPDPKMFDTLDVHLDTTFESFVRPFFQSNAGQGSFLLARAILGILALLFMALPALNLVTINLSRILERSSEIGVRKAFGAPRRSLVSQFVMENVVLTLIGGAIAFGLSAAILVSLNASDVFPNVQLDLNLRIFGYGMLMAVAFGLVSGVYPAWRMARMHPVNALRGGAQ